MELVNIRNAELREGHNWSYRSEDLSKWVFPWLLSNFQDPVWLIDSGEDKPFQISFNSFIPTTGGYLANPKYNKVVNTIKKVLALSRTGHLSTDDSTIPLLTRAASMEKNANSLKALALFLFKTYGEDEVAKNGFNLLTKADIKQFHIDIATGRADKASGLLDCIYDKLGTLSAKEVRSLLGIYDDNEHKEIVMKEFLTKLSIVKNRVSQFTSNQIISKLIELFPELSLAITGKKRNDKPTEYPNSCPSTISADTGIGKTTFDSLTQAPNLLQRLSIYLPELSDYSNPKVEVTEEFANTYIKPKERTPNIPTDTALYYLNEAIQLITVYGEGIVEAKRECEIQLTRIHKENTKYRRDYILNAERCPFKVKIPENKFTKDYNVTRYNELPTLATPKDRRTSVTVLQGYKMLVAATYILINTFCIKRVTEILELKESNLEHGLWGGYEIFFGIRKAAPTEDSVLVTGRPIPHVVFEGFSFLSEANEHYYDESEDPCIFPAKYTSKGNGESPKNKNMSRAVMVNLLKEFADFIELPTEICNGVESRFYLSRTHVLRRFGARAYFSLSDLSDFPALTWLMGHRSTEETWHYLLEDIDNEHLSEEEAISVLDAIYKPNIDTSQVESVISSNLGIMFNNLSQDVALQYVKEQISQGAKVYNYVDDSGKTIVWMETADEQENN